MNLPKTIIISILLTSAYGEYSSFTASNGTRIIGGTRAPKGAFPYMASLCVRRKLVCGGSILNNRWILTAAHCLLDRLTVYVGSNSLCSNVQYKVSEQYEHPKTSFWKPLGYDIALIKLQKRINFNNFIKQISLPSSKIKDNQKAVLSGWGLTQQDGVYPSRSLQYFNVTLLTPETCKKKLPWYVIFYKHNICAQGNSEQGVCHGDSGSPLVFNGTVVGVASRLAKAPCANGYPDIYTNVYYFLDWIEEIMKT